MQEGHPTTVSVGKTSQTVIMAQPLSSPGRSDAFTAPFLPAVQVGCIHRSASPVNLFPDYGNSSVLGVCGVVVGSAVGIARSQHPVLYSTIAGVQWFAVGSSFYCQFEYTNARDVLIETKSRHPSCMLIFPIEETTSRPGSILG